MWLLWWIILAPLLLVTFIYNFIKIYETICKNRIVNVSTGKPLQNTLTLYQSFKMMTNFNRPMVLKFFDYVNKFNYEPFVFYFANLRPVVMFSTPKAAKDIFINYKDVEKFNSIASPVQRKFSGSSLVVMNGEEWERNRHVVNPAFTNTDRFVTIFSEKVIQCVERIEQESTLSDQRNYSIIKPKDFMTRMTLDAISIAGFGFDFNYVGSYGNIDVNNKEEQFKKEALEAYQYIINNTLNPKYLLLRELYYSLPFSENFKMRKSLETFDKLIYDVIDKKRKEFKENGRLSENTLLDLMIVATDSPDADYKLTNQELRDNVVLFFLAGHETTSSNLSTLMYELASYPQIQQKLYEEIYQVFPNIDNKLLTVDDIPKIHSIEYLNWTINENLRLNPPAPMVLQRIISKRDIIIDGLHHDPDIWGEDANEFRPERFNEKERKERPPCSFLPFGLGQRKCLGNNFSLLEQKVFLIYLLSRFRLEHLPISDVEERMFEESDNIADSGVPYQRRGFILTLDSVCQLKLVNRKHRMTSEV
ncbi:hypothetical protein ABK040_005921 [Willaertia magna]